MKFMKDLEKHKWRCESPLFVFRVLILYVTCVPPMDRPCAKGASAAASAIESEAMAITNAVRVLCCAYILSPPPLSCVFFLL